jgi:hypothetical protein
MSKDLAMTWTIHRFEAETFLFDIECEHIFLVVIPVTRRFPEVGFVNVWTDDFIVTSFAVL